MKHIILLIVFGAFLSGCASTPSPEKICTTEWIAPRANHAIDRLETKTSKAVKTLKKAGVALLEGRKPGMFTMMRLSSAFEDIKYEFTDGPAMQDLKTLAKTCNNSEVITKSMRQVFENQGVSDKLLNFMESLPLYQDIIRENLRDLAESSAAERAQSNVY